MTNRSPSATSQHSPRVTGNCVVAHLDLPTENYRPDAVAGRPRNSDLEAREARLLAAAVALFSEKGYAGTSLEMIAVEARVAVRTIYNKFGGKLGLLSAIIGRGQECFAAHFDDMASDFRPLRIVLTEFGLRFLELFLAPESIALQRMVIAESYRHPELGRIFFDSGIGPTYGLLSQFFERPDVRAQLRADSNLERLPAYLISCVVGDQFHSFFWEAELSAGSTNAHMISARIDLFLRSVLR